MPSPDPKPSATRTGPPVQRRRGSTPIVLSFAIAVVVGVMLLWFIVHVASKPGSKVHLGADVYQVGPTKTLAAEIAKHGPILNPALIQGGPDIYIQHLGSDPDTGWKVFEARAAGTCRQCTVQWQAAGQQFLDPCDHRTYPADGTGLRAYATTVENGRLAVDLRASP